MIKIKGQGLRWLKILHLFLVVLFLGGIISTLSINLNFDVSNYEDAYKSYETTIIISENVVKFGAIGTLLIGVVYSIFTSWGFFKHRWVTVKWIMWIGQTFIGIFVVDRLMVSNMSILESEKSLALTNPVFLQNDLTRKYVVIFQILLSVMIICISVIKPWKKSVN